MRVSSLFLSFPWSRRLPSSFYGPLWEIGLWNRALWGLQSAIICKSPLMAFFFVGASFAYSALLMSSGKTRILIPATILLAATSIPLSYALIFGKFGFARMGMRGAALSSLAAEAVVFSFLTIYVVRGFESSRYKLFHILSVDWRTLRLLSRISASIAAQRSLEVIRWFVFFLILERVSLEALAIANIVYTCYIVFWIPTEGFAERRIPW